MPADVARVVVAAPGVTASALTSLSPAPLAIVDDSSGTLAFFHTDATLSSEAAPLVSSSALVPTDPVLQSCNYLLSDVPAAQPFIKAAIAGAVADNLAPSAASLSASLAAVEIGDNPVTSGSLVIILLVSGVPQGSVDGHTVDGPESSIFVLLNRDTLAVTGTGPGTW
jgi:hypothetical protein